MHPIRRTIAAVGLASGLALVSTAGGMPGDTTLVSRSSAGVQGNGRSEIQTNGVSAHGAVSADGRYVAFQSSADNLVPGDTNQATDIFVHDRLMGTTGRVSVGTGGVQTNDFFGSRDPSISADGRYVAFTSDAQNLEPEPDVVADVFLHDRVTGETRLVAVGRVGNVHGNFGATMPAISADGRYVAFQTSAALFPADTALGSTDIYVWDRTTRTVVDWVSPGTGPAQASINATISADGRYVAFESSSPLVPADTNGTWDVYLRDRQAGTTELVSVDQAGGPADGVSEWGAVSADGRYVAFQSRANDLVLPDAVFTYEVYIRDRVAGTTERISLASTGAQMSGDAGRPSISEDGRLVAFDATAQLAASDNDPVQDVYVRDRSAGTTLHVSVNTDGSNDGNGAEPAAIAADGSMVAFDTAGSLAAGDTNANFDVFVHELPSANNSPVVDAGLDATIAEGQMFSSPGSFSDPDSASWAATADYGDGSGGQPLALSGNTFMLSHLYDDNGAYTTAVTVTDDDGASGSDSALVTVNNVEPTASFAAPSPIQEGGTSMLSLSSPFDPSGADTAAGLRYSFACDGQDASLVSSYGAGGATESTTCGFADNGSFPVKGRILDKDDGASTYEGTVVVENVAPTVGEITAPSDPVAVNTTVNAGASFADPGTLDTHSASWNWGDGASSLGAVTEGGGAGTAGGSHAYTVPGVYTVSVTVADDDGGTVQAFFQYLVAYDPNGPGARGRGSIVSPLGAYVPDPSLTGEAVFGFQSKYRPGQSVPSGHTRFKFRLADLSFVSSNYQWLVVAGPRAQFKGTGEINGAGSYGFLLTAVDGDLSGGSGIDKFRIKIWDNASGELIYDNKIGDADSADPQAITEGSIAIS
jgi:Tol biopolymer transport system component